MNVDLTVQLGLSGTQIAQPPMWLDPGSVGATSSWAGSFHVLSMGRHYDDYVVTSKILSLPAIAGFPSAHPYERLAGKIRASGVTGNIGESIAALFARRNLRAAIGDIAHVHPRRPFRSRKSPDYLMRIGRCMPGPFRSLLPVLRRFAWPEWWPVESKARATEAGCVSARRDALKQLKAYWSLLARTDPAAVGYGLVVTLKYQPPRSVRATLLLPKDASALASELVVKRELEDAGLRAALYGC
jgi:hypothetical protein